jgi:hypothetical protein
MRRYDFGVTCRAVERVPKCRRNASSAVRRSRSDSVGVAPFAGSGTAIDPLDHNQTIEANKKIHTNRSSSKLLSFFSKSCLLPKWLRRNRGYVLLVNPGWLLLLECYWINECSSRTCCGRLAY